MFYKVAKAVNAIVAVMLLVVIMRHAHDTWSLYGPYTLGSFFASLFMHGIFCYGIYWVVDFLLRKITKHV